MRFPVGGTAVLRSRSALVDLRFALLLTFLIHGSYDAVIRGALGQARRGLERSLEDRRLAPLYAPDPTNLDIEAHLSGALNWLKRAHDAGTDRGVSYGVVFGADFEASYPETTGYICQSFVEMWKRTGERDLLDRAIEMGDWEAQIQMPEGAVMGGTDNAHPTPAVFNTGMVLLGWSALIRVTGEDRFRVAAQRASDWLACVQESNGNWVRGNSRFADATATVYNVKAAWGLCEAGIAMGRPDWVDAAVRNAEYCLTRQQPNGWFAGCCLTDPRRPLLHTIAYTMQGLMGLGTLTEQPRFITAARLTADRLLALLGSDGFLPGRYDEQFRPAARWCCVTGTAQTSIVWSQLYRLTGEAKYRDAALRANRYLMSHHDIRNPDLRLNGGVTGSWPVNGEYGRLRILNWATKFFVDALAAEKYEHPDFQAM